MEPPTAQGSIQPMQQNSNQSHTNPIIEPSTHCDLQVFSEACSTGHLESATLLARGDHAPNKIYYLNFGLVSAIIHKQLEIVRYLLSHGATIDESVTAMAVMASVFV